MVEKDAECHYRKGPGAAMEFALAVVELLRGRDKVAELKEAMIVNLIVNYEGCESNEVYSDYGGGKVCAWDANFPNNFFR